MVEQWSKEHCNACGGSGIQTNKDGINITCPVCSGKGFRLKSSFEDLPPGTYCSTVQSNTITY